MPFIYVLRLADRSLYVGRTDDVAAAVQQHNHGHGGPTTKGHRPVYLVFTEELASEDEAERRERQLKRWPDKRLEALVAGREAAPAPTSRLKKR
jgi:putative endonuclease